MCNGFTVHIVDHRKKKMADVGPLGSLPNMRWCANAQRYFALGQPIDLGSTEGNHRDQVMSPSPMNFADCLNQVGQIPVNPRIASTLRKRGRLMSSECSICLRSAQTGNGDRRMRFVSLPCKHTFHLYCIEEWLCKRNGSCPICRFPADIALSEAARSAMSIS